MIGLLLARITNPPHIRYEANPPPISYPCLERKSILSNYSGVVLEELRHSHQLPFLEEPKTVIDWLLFTKPQTFPPGQHSHGKAYGIFISEGETITAIQTNSKASLKSS